MAAGAAHEMNNPLTVIKRAGADAAAAPDVGAGDRGAAEAIAQGSSRQISDLITSMHLLASPPTPRMTLSSGRASWPSEAVRKAQHRTGLEH
jgi:signal transduction histidine kinase